MLMLQPIQNQQEPIALLRHFQENNPSLAFRLLDRIRFAAVNRLIVELDYRKESGERKSYQIEPYSLRTSRDGNTLLYAVKLPALSIRSFRTDHMIAARITDKSFTPRYRVEFIPEGPPFS